MSARDSGKEQVSGQKPVQKSVPKGMANPDRLVYDYQTGKNRMTVLDQVRDSFSTPTVTHETSPRNRVEQFAEGLRLHLSDSLAGKPQ
jgi:hypothetical protein